tara:strand:- start:194 stop:412 length:219 start_codon:yes stop_codon:yes gene_type:complete
MLHLIIKNYYSRISEQTIFNGEYYRLLCNQARSPHLWYLDDQDNWQLRKTISDQDIQISQEDTAKNWQGIII